MRKPGAFGKFDLIHARSLRAFAAARDYSAAPLFERSRA
jgi:hypothetical protein